MAKKKTEEKLDLKIELEDKKEPLRDAPAYPDFTYEDKPLLTYVRFNSQCVLGIFVDFDNDTIDGVIFNELDGTKRMISGSIGDPE